MQPLRDAQVTEGGRLCLSCTFSGRPKPQIQWLRNNALVLPSAVYRVCVFSSFTELVISFSPILVTFCQSFLNTFSLYKCRIIFSLALLAKPKADIFPPHFELILYCLTPNRTFPRLLSSFDLISGLTVLGSDSVAVLKLHDPPQRENVQYRG